MPGASCGYPTDQQKHAERSDKVECYDGSTLAVEAHDSTGTESREREGSPRQYQSGGKVISTKTCKVNHPAANALRLAAQSLLRSPTVLGDFYRRMRYRSCRGCTKKFLRSVKRSPRLAGPNDPLFPRSFR